MGCPRYAARPATPERRVTLQEPPKQKKAAGLAGRFIGLILLLAAFAVVVWTTATIQQIGALERSDPFVHAPGEHLSVGNVIIHLRTFGNGSSTSVLVHDDTIAGGAPLADLAENLSQTDRTVLVPDLVGFGFSSRPTEPGRLLSTSGQADTVIAWLEDRQSDAVELIGFGWGGELATEVAILRPDLVTRLVLVDVPSVPMPVRDDAWLEALPFGVGEAVAHTVEGASDRAQVRFPDTCPAWADCSDPEVIEQRRRAATVPGTARAIWARRSTSPASVAGTRLDEIQVPVELVAVEASREEIEEVAARFPAAQVTTASAATLVEAVAS